MLRAVRFAVKYNWKMPMSLVKAMKRNADTLQNISSERIQDELNKILLTDHPEKGLRLLSYTGLNKHVIPELDLCRGVTQNAYHKDDVFDHILEVVKNTPKNLTARLGALFHDIGKPQTRSVGEDNRVHFYEHEDVGAEMATAIMKRLKYPGDITNSVNRVVKNHMRLKAAGPEGDKLSDKAIRRFMADSGEDLDVQLMVMQADNVSHSEVASMPNQIAQLTDRMKVLAAAQPAGAKPTLPINGNDIMKTLGIKPGPIVKNLLQAVEDAWYADPTLSANDALGVAKMAYEKATGSQTSDTDVMNQKIKNPETDNDILIKTALKYPDDHPAKIAAMKIIKK
jgi:putative nucleotidyltransferase with HDIG domain